MLFAELAPIDRAFAVFIDDLGFDAAADARALRSMLEGGAEARPANARLIVTSNRRHLLPRDIAAQSSAINPRDSIDDELALADRFGLSLGFHNIDQEAYLAIVRGYAEAHGLTFEPACLAFHETDRPVRTASSEQVRRPINREGVGQWRAYAPWLAPLEEALGPVLDDWQ